MSGESAEKHDLEYTVVVSAALVDRLEERDNSMPRDYAEIQKEIALTGFFSEYLPPCFCLDAKVLNNPPPEKCDLIPPYSFSMSRFNGNDARRTLFIPEIGSYIAAYQYMKENQIIQELIEFTESQNHSFSPILGAENSIVRHEQAYGGTVDNTSELSTEYIENIAKKIILSSGAKKILKLDISNCFSSFYMHMIPAIMLGSNMAQVEYEKRQKGLPCNELYEKYRKLDEVIRRQNLNRTNGLLPGVLTSKIIAEALLTRVDIELESAGFNFARYVDDYEVFLYDDIEKSTISEFSKILKAYGFSLNFEKTEIVDFPYYLVENFNKILGDKLDEAMDSEAIIDIFNAFLEMEKKGTKGAVRFLIKTLEQKSWDIEVLDKDLYKAYLISVMANNERSLTKACSILIDNKDDYILSSNDIVNIGRLLEKHIAYEHDLEVIWLLYLLVETGNIQSDSQIIEHVVKTQNELAHLILLNNALINDQQKAVINHKAKSWFLLYELFSQNLITREEFVERLGIRHNLNMYQKFKDKQIHFIQDNHA